MSSTQASAMRPTVNTVSVGFPENPNPGSDGITTSNASSAEPPWATGSVSGPMSRKKSMTELGQP